MIINALTTPAAAGPTATEHIAAITAETQLTRTLSRSDVTAATTAVHKKE